MNNPFEAIEAKLISIEKLLLEIKQQPKRNEPAEPTDQLLTVREAAEFLSLTVSTIYSKVSKGELPVMKRAKRLYFSKTELLDYLKAGRKKLKTDIEAEAETYLLNHKKGLKNGK